MRVTKNQGILSGTSGLQKVNEYLTNCINVQRNRFKQCYFSKENSGKHNQLPYTTSWHIHDAGTCHANYGMKGIFLIKMLPVQYNIYIIIFSPMYICSPHSSSATPLPCRAVTCIVFFTTYEAQYQSLPFIPISRLVCPHFNCTSAVI